MPRIKKALVAEPVLSGAQSVYILERARADRKITNAEIREYLASMHQEISHLEARLVHLKDAAVGSVKHAIEVVKRRPDRPGKKAEGGDGPFPKTSEKRRRASKPITAERRASMQLQGQYLGLLAKLPHTQKEKIKRIAKVEGREAAIALMKKERD